MEEESGWLVAFMISFFINVFLIYMFYDISESLEKLKHPNTYKYKVRELERNTIFVIEDPDSLYKPLDSVWVNMNTQRVDVKDSVAMMCVVVERQ